MLARLALRRGVSSALAGPSRSLATVEDVTVRCTFIKPNGKRVTVPGRVGWSLLKTAQHHDVGLEGYMAHPSWYDDYGDGPATKADHVIVAKEWYGKVSTPVFPEEAAMLDTIPHATDTSRLAAVVSLTKELDGITVYIPPGNESYESYNW